MGAHDTADTSYYIMSLIFKGLIHNNDILVDIGCGKGRVLNYWLDNFNTNQIIGIELDPEIAQKTAIRMKEYKNVKIIIGSVIENLPYNADLFYLFNPFNFNVMTIFKESLISRLFNEKSGWVHSFKIVYYNPVCIQIFMEDERFSCSEIILPNEFHKCYMIKQSENCF